MSQNGPAGQNKRFGQYLRRIREDRRISLDAVEEMTHGYPEPVTKSHLSRIENGRAAPSFPRLFALSRVYGIPISSLAEQFETDLHRELTGAVPAPSTPDLLTAELRELRLSGRYGEALALALAALEEPAATRDPGFRTELRLQQIDCLTHLERFESAKLECEKLLNDATISPQQNLLALLSFVICCYRLKRYTIAGMGLDRADAELAAHDHPPRSQALLESTRAAVVYSLGRRDEAIRAFSKAAELHDSVGEPFEACKNRINLGQSRLDLGGLREARKQLTAALDVAEKAGYDRLRALALSHLALVSFREERHEAAERDALRSNSIARPREYFSIVFRNCFYLREIARSRQDEAGVRSNNKTLRTYVGRVDQDLDEVIRFRNEQAGDPS